MRHAHFEEIASMLSFHYNDSQVKREDDWIRDLLHLIEVVEEVIILPKTNTLSTFIG